MKFYIISSIFLLLGSLIEADPSCKSSPCISLDVYYETRCGDSIDFIAENLEPSYHAFKDHLDINFVPYGKANQTRNENGTWIFSCQHGENECEGNKAQACALDVIKKTSAPEKIQEHSVNFVNCIMESVFFSPFSARSVPTCANSTGLSEVAQQNITNCFESSVGDDLLAAYGNKTQSVQSPLQFVPTIIINGNYSEEQPSEAFYDFDEVICNLLTEGGKNLTYCDD